MFMYISFLPAKHLRSWQRTDNEAQRGRNFREENKYARFETFAVEILQGD